MAYHDQHRPSGQGTSADYSPYSSGNATPTTNSTSGSYLTGLVGGFGGLVRRFSDMTSGQAHPSEHKSQAMHGGASPLSWSHHLNNGVNGVYTPPFNRSASPMRPPPLEPLQLKGFRDDTIDMARLLNPAVAEEIRIMIPERQRIEDEWNLVYSLDQDGASLATLYEKCSGFDGTRASFVLVVRDNEGGVSDLLSPPPPHLFACWTSGGEGHDDRANMINHLSSLAPIYRIHPALKRITSAMVSASCGKPPSSNLCSPPYRRRPLKTPPISLA